MQFDVKIADLLKKLDEAYRILNDRVAQVIVCKSTRHRRVSYLQLCFSKYCIHFRRHLDAVVFAETEFS